MSVSQFKEIEYSVSQYTPRPSANPVTFDENKYYNFLVFDVETTTTGKSAELCQLSATDKTGLHTFSEYILPTGDIHLHASIVNHFQIRCVNGERKLFKDHNVLPALAVNEAIVEFQKYVSRSIERAKTITKKHVQTILIGHNASTFDAPILLRNAGNEFVLQIQSLDVWFADSLSLFRVLIKKQIPSLKNEDGTFPRTNQTSLFQTLFNTSFNAHDALEDVHALRKMLFSSRLELSTKMVVDNSSVVSTCHIVATSNYLDCRNNLVQSFKGKLYYPYRNDSPLKKNMVEKIAGSALSYDDLQSLFTRYGKEGLVAILSKVPSSSSTSSARGTRTRRILNAVVQHFENTKSPENT